MAEFSSYQKEIKNFIDGGKAEVAKAVTSKGVSTENNSTFQTIKDNIGKIKTGSNYYPCYGGSCMTDIYIYNSVGNTYTFNMKQLGAGTKWLNEGYKKARWHYDATSVVSNASYAQKQFPFLPDKSLGTLSIGQKFTLATGEDPTDYTYIQCSDMGTDSEGYGYVSFKVLSTTVTNKYSRMHIYVYYAPTK